MSNPYYYYRNYSILLALIKRLLSPLNNRLSRDSMLVIRSLGEKRLPANQILAEGALTRNSCTAGKTVYSIAPACNGYKYPESFFSTRYGPSFLTQRLMTLRLLPHAEESKLVRTRRNDTAFRRRKTAKSLNISVLRPAKWRRSLTPKLVKPPFFPSTCVEFRGVNAIATSRKVWLAAVALLFSRR